LDATFHYNRGIALQNQHQTDAAIKDFSEALNITASFFRANISRALALVEKGDLDAAIADYTRAMEFDPKDASIYFGRGAAKQKKKDLEGALLDYDKAIELDASNALAYASRGVVKALLHKPDYAADFETAFRLDPSLRASYGQFYQQRRKP